METTKIYAVRRCAGGLTDSQIMAFFPDSSASEITTVGSVSTAVDHLPGVDYIFSVRFTPKYGSTIYLLDHHHEVVASDSVVKLKAVIDSCGHCSRLPLKLKESLNTL